MRVAVLGASPNKERYANKAIHALRKHGHETLPVNPAHSEIEGLPTSKSLGDIKGPVDTITVYVGPAHIGPLIPAIITTKPRRVIMNPGAESEELRAALTAAKIESVEACTLVMLATGQF